ncbi:glycosyltransferase family 4 protein [Leptolyngbya sp. AN03gr2]|uniref:glycosyltransferase family 4 protein n=1 Tax=unclassified Leptolyngbya TaxID=2650499 RepID=UPI003D316B86
MSERYAMRSEKNPHQAGQQDRFMIFDLDARGHHPGYIQHLVKYWCENDLPGHLDVLVSQVFIQRHPQIVALADQRTNIRFVSISKAEQTKLVSSDELGSSFKGRIIRAFQEWKIIRKYAISLETTHVFLMYLDRVLLRMALGVKLPCAMSVIYFRPILHYAVFPNYCLEGKESFWQWRDRVCLARFLPLPKLQTVFCLDQFAVDYINQVYNTSKAVHLADPVQRYNHTDAEAEALRTQLGIEPGRSVFLMFGALENDRKGLKETLEAIEQLPPALCRRMTVVLAGTITGEAREQLEARIDQITRSHPVQIVTQFGFVPDEAIHPYFQISDVVLVPYQRHIGMSAILVRAAAAQKPVLASDFGVIGELTRRYQLGLTIDAASPEQIAQAMMRFLLEVPGELCNPVKQKQFADHNTAQQFASQIFQALYTPPSTRGSRSLTAQPINSPQLSNSRRL